MYIYTFRTNLKRKNSQNINFSCLDPSPGESAESDKRQIATPTGKCGKIFKFSHIFQISGYAWYSPI